MSEGSGQTLKLEICAMDRAPIVLEAREVAIPGVQGIFTVLPSHAALVSALTIGVLTCDLANGEKHAYAISGGFAHVKDDRVVILTQTAEEGAEIDIERAQAAHERAQETLRSLRDSGDVAQAEARLRRAAARISARGQRVKGGASEGSTVER